MMHSIKYIVALWTFLTKNLSFVILFFIKEQITYSIPSGLRIALASHYLSRYKKIVLWGSGINPASVEIEALYTDMQYVRIHRAATHQEGRDLNHYTDMLVRETILNIFAV